MRATAIVVAAGSGVRFGAANKAFWSLAGRPLITYSLDAFQRSDSIEQIVVVAGEHTLGEARSLASSQQWSKLNHVVAGGTLRQDSVRCGLAIVGEQCQFVAIHDAARPLIQVADIDRCVAAAAESGAAILAVPVTDTIKRAANGRIMATVPRDGLWMAQTPQVFAATKFREAFQAVNHAALSVTDEAGLFEALGMEVAIVEASSTNIKITVAADLETVEALIAHRPVVRSPA